MSRYTVLPPNGAAGIPCTSLSEARAKARRFLPEPVEIMDTAAGVPIYFEGEAVVVRTQAGFDVLFEEWEKDRDNAPFPILRPDER